MKKLAIYLLMMLSLLIVCFTLFSKKVNAETSKKVDVITEVKIQNDKGEALTGPVGRFDSFRLNAKFALEGKNVKAGDTTEVSIASPIDIKSQDFEINDSITGELIANAKVDAAAGKIILTFTKFVEEKNDVSGSFFFYAQVNKVKSPNDGEVPVKVSVNDKEKFTGKVTSGTIGGGYRYSIIKSGWSEAGNKELGFRISVNRTNEVINDAVVTDTLKSPGITYKQGSFKIKKGTWEYTNGKWVLKNAKDVTADYKVNINGNSFSINLGNIAADDQFAIEYSADVNYTVVDGEKILNQATIKGSNKDEYASNSTVKIQIAGGEGIGYEFSIKVTKVDEQNGPLKGAKFQVIRQATGQVLGEFESDAKGEFSLKELLRDKYIIKEIQAPEGYELAEDTIVEASEFTTPTKPVSKTIINKKEKPAKTQAVIELDKVLTGRDLVDGEFSFELYEGANKLQTTTNQSGKITFEPIEFTAEGEHTYTVKEVKGDNATIAYDASEKQVTVKVTRDGGALKAEVVYPESKTFTNAFTPNAANATIELTKELTGRDLVDGEFSFELYEGANKLQTVTNKAGKVSFDAISYTAEGEHTYTVKEVKGTTPGITYDTSEKQVTVKVTKDGNNLKATVVYPESKVFTNTYSAPSPAKAQISVSKILEGRALKDGEFSFTLLDEAGKVLQTKQNAADGSVAFDEISYSQEDAEKTFHYTIKEVIPTSQEKGMTYDQASIEVTVTVTKDDASNTINATVAYGEKKSFINTFVTSEIPPTPPTVDKPEAKLYTIQLHKVNGEGQALAGAVFGLFEADGVTAVANPYGEGQATATSDASGLVSFVGFAAKDYVVKELTAPEGYQLSTASITVSEAELTASADLAVDKGNVANKPYTSIPPTPPTVDKPELKLYNIQLHKANADGNALAGAVFGLFEADGTTPVANPYGEGQATATSDASGLVTFTGFEAKDYVVRELTAPEGYQLSTDVIKVSASELKAATNLVVDKGTVVNKPFTSIPPTPPTVDKPELKLYSIQLHKVNNEGKPLVGAVFGLFEADGTTPVANPYGEGQATATSDANGLVTFTGLVAKDYVVKEITAPEGYQLSEEAITVSASQLIASTDQVLDQGKVVNKPFTAIPPTPPTVDKPELKLYNIQLHKVNKEGKALAGAVFGLFEADGTTPVANPYGEGQATATSDANGLVIFKGFEARDYVIKELTAPTGYQLLTNPITVTAEDYVQATDLVVDKGNVVNELTPPTPPTGKTPPPSTDKPKKQIPSNPPKGEGKKSLPSTGETVSEGLVAAGLALAVTGSALVYKKREN